MLPRATFAALILAICLITVQASFIAIDYGSEWMKASLMTPGRKIDILLNTDSKRKIQSSVGWNKQDRLFGTDAMNVAARFPSDVFPSLKYLLGSRYGGSQANYYSRITRAELIEARGRGTCAVRRPDGTEWTVEELIAMQFAYIKDLAETEAEEAITEAVVTVPPFYTQFERQSMIDALEIAGLKPIALINDGMAVAINYATGRTFTDKHEHHIIYDAGASSVTATVVSFSQQSIPDSSKILKSSLKEATHVDVRGVGFETVASGTELDLRLRNAIAKRFEDKHGIPVKNNARAMTRLMKEAQRVKGVLSANTETLVRADSLVDEIDFKDTFTRVEFEKLSSDLIPRYTIPLTDALEAANLTLADITSVIMTGGASHIPMIQSSVKDLVGAKIANNVNKDEAAVLGAAFYGATTKALWRTKPMRFQDLGSYDVNIKYLKEDSNKQLVSPILSPKAKTGVVHAKKLTFPKRAKDFTVTVAYKLPGSIDFPQDIFEARISGVTEALVNLTTEGVALPQIRASFGYTDSGLIFVEEAVATGESKRQRSSGSAASTSESSSSSATDTATSTTLSPAPTVEVVTVPLALEVVPLSITPLSFEQKIASQARLAAIVEAERAKARREEALNHLEGYLYRLRDLLEGEDISTSSFKEFVKPHELDAFSTGLANTFEWLHEQGSDADAATLWKKRNDLETLEHPIISRYKEAKTGPQALSDLQKAHALGRAFLQEAHKNRTEALAAGETPRFTEEELNTVDEVVTESEDWLRKRTDEQKKLSKRDDPVLKTAEMQAKGVAIQKAVKDLQRRKPLRSKPATTTSNSSSEQTASAGGERGRDEL